MRINFNQTNKFLQTDFANSGFRQNVSGKAQPFKTGMRSDTAVLSQQGKAAGRLANLMSQKEMIQMNRDSLLGRALDDESQAGSAGIKEQLDDYEEQLETLNEQIAAEMAKQPKDAGQPKTEYQKPQNTQSSESLDDSIAKLTELSADLNTAKISGQASVRREGEENVCKAEIKQGSTAAKQKLEKIKKMENYIRAYQIFR